MVAKTEKLYSKKLVLTLVILIVILSAGILYVVIDSYQIVSLQKFDVILDNRSVNVSNAGSCYWNFEAKYNGYVEVTVISSSTNVSYARVHWASDKMRYDNSTFFTYREVDLSKSLNQTVDNQYPLGYVSPMGIGYFPVIRDTTVFVEVGGLNWTIGTDFVVSIKYYY